MLNWPIRKIAALSSTKLSMDPTGWTLIDLSVLFKVIPIYLISFLINFNFA